MEEDDENSIRVNNFIEMMKDFEKKQRYRLGVKRMMCSHLVCPHYSDHVFSHEDQVDIHEGRRKVHYGCIPSLCDACKRADIKDIPNLYMCPHPSCFSSYKSRNDMSIHISRVHGEMDICRGKGRRRRKMVIV